MPEGVREGRAVLVEAIGCRHKRAHMIFFHAVTQIHPKNACYHGHECKCSHHCGNNKVHSHKLIAPAPGQVSVRAPCNINELKHSARMS